MAEAISSLEVDPAAMRRNLDRLDGLVLAERLMLALAPKMGRREAHQAVEALSRRAVAEKRHLREIALADRRVGAHLEPSAVEALFDPLTYLGAAETFIDRALAAHDAAREARAAWRAAS
jgi:3-carboxy-cis,cis-muconate cycloisomerase